MLAKVNRSPQQDEASVDFVLYGSMADSGQNPVSLYLLLEWQNGQQQRLQLPLPHLAPAGRGIARIMALPWKHYFSRGWRLLRQRQSGLLLRKFFGMARATITSGWLPSRLLKWTSAEGKPLVLVIDHDLGGGANIYRNLLLARLASEGFVPLLLSAHHGILSYQLTAMRGRRSRSAYIDDLPTLFCHLSQASIQQVVFNNILSFPEPLALVNALSSWLQEQQTVNFLFLVHDYYCICPVWLLLDHTGSHCGIPDSDACATCLRSNASHFLEFSAGASVMGWRAVWRELLMRADEIRCFSNSSRALLLRGHPQCDPARISVVPHRLEHVPSRKPVLQDGGGPVIGVIGHISYHKGAQVVSALANHIALSGVSSRIVVIGTIELELPADIATVTGPYSHDDLPALVERYGVNVGFFPSICPETFSYVTEEMMAMELPILAFSLGAPGERVSAYQRGMVIPVGTPDSILAAVEILYKAHILNGYGHTLS